MKRRPKPQQKVRELPANTNAAHSTTTNELREKALAWAATFADLRVGGVTLSEWLEHHRAF